jgi:lipopolysaccharide/colanic/teichoic acid biosynthesis glycosyltransferase
MLRPREFTRVVAKERMRCDRHRFQFGLLTLCLRCEKPDLAKTTGRAAKVLHRKLRLTDEKGLMRDGRICVLLPMTDTVGSQKVLQMLVEEFGKSNIYFKSELFVYPNERFFDHDQSQDQETREGELVELVSSVLSDGRRDDRRAEADEPASPVPMQMLSAPYPRWKRGIDIAGATFGLVVASPVILVAAAAIKATSTGNVFYTQERTGFQGQRFKIYKLRSMVQNADSQQTKLVDRNERDGPAFKMSDDPRVTLIGKALRATGLDELPQFWNVLRGDMSLVGPRPLPCCEADSCQPWQKRRLDTKPGITCTWQILKGGDEEIMFVDWMRMDLKYIGQHRLTSDLGLLCQTIKSVVLGRVGR